MPKEVFFMFGKRRKYAVALAVLIAAAVFLSGYALREHDRAETAHRAARYAEERAFEELCAAVKGLDNALQKSRYAVSPSMTAALCAEVYSRALSAESALSSLPFSTLELEQTAAFLSRAGDYASYLLRQTGRGEAPEGEVLENIAALSDAAGILQENLNQLRADIAEGRVFLSAAALESGAPSVTDSFLQMEQEFPETPSLVYDGPFSASIADRTPRMLQDAAEIREDDALRIAAGFLGTRSNLLSLEGRAEGKIPCYRIAGGGYTVAVSVQGGYVVQAICDEAPTRSQLPTETALEKAAEFLREHEYRHMKESYHIRQDNILTVTYCYQDGDTLCYPDMVKLAVSLDDGKLLRFDAQSYLTSHGERELPTPTIGAEEAKSMVGSGLTVVSEGLAVIPSEGEEELFCRELICETEDGRHVLLYVNAETGEQERILILLEDDSGTLAV